MIFRYSRWDGSQNVPDFDADDVLAQMSDDLLSDGDPWRAMRRLMQQGFQPPEGRKMTGLKDLLEQLKRRRQQQLDRYNLGSSIDDIKKKLDEVIQTERAGVEKNLPEGKERTRRERRLNGLPSDPAGRIRQLQDYDFFDADAKRQFEELLNSLRQQMMQPFMQGMQQSLQGMTPDDLRRMREMMQDLNRMLRERADGGEPDFEAFKQKWGQHFPGVENLDQLDRADRPEDGGHAVPDAEPHARAARADRRHDALALHEGRALEASMSQLAETLSELLPLDEMAQSYPFRGEQETTLAEAMRLMDELQRMDELERELRGVRALEELERVVLGRPAGAGAGGRARSWNGCRSGEEAGGRRLPGARRARLKMTPRGIRKIAEKALPTSSHR